MPLLVLRSVVLAIFSCLCLAHCAPLGVKSADRPFLASLNQSSKVSVGSYHSFATTGTPGGSSSSAEVLAALVLSGVNSHDAQQKTQALYHLSRETYHAYLDLECLGAMERTLAKSVKFKVLPSRTEAIFSHGNGGVTAAASQGLSAAFEIRTLLANTVGWNKKMRMIVVWTLVSPDGKTRFKAITDATSAMAYDILPDHWDPVYADVFIGLAEENARSVTALLAQQQ